ncbi:MAG: hypothetical protein JW891_04905 [Candidatus Lokiarchaeota archaeon]|nr:hypothetical protein [Candidatus Lokiarchaeota archaeon]
MAKKDKGDEPVLIKDFTKLKKELENLDERMKKQIENLYTYIGKKIEDLEGKIVSIENRSSSNQTLIKEQGKIQTDIQKDLEAIKKDILTVKKLQATNQQQIEQQIKTQESIIMDMIKKFNEKLLNDKAKMDADIKELKNQQDVLKISFTVNEKRLLEKIKSEVTIDIKEAVKDKEYEILMKYWLQDLKDIVDNFDRLKKMHPKEFTLQLAQIVDTIEMFRGKIKQ